MPEFPFVSLRDWLDFLDQKDQLVHIKKEVDLREDISAITMQLSRMAVKKGHAPAVMFENIKGYPGWRIASSTFITQQRRSWALGAPEDRPGFLKDVTPRLDRRVPPMEVSNGPCKELKFIGDQVDLTKLPIPFTGEYAYEGTPSITAGISNKRDPESAWQNIAVRRYGLKGKRVLSEYINPAQQDFVIWGKYLGMNKTCPVAIIIGADPITYLVSQTKEPPGVCEYDLWAPFTGVPLEVVKCETSDLLVPASAEVVIEGELKPYPREMDGPFPEFCGYYTTLAEVARVEVKAVTMRKNPIYYYMNMGLPPTEGNDIGALMESLTIYREVAKAYPGILDIYNPHWLITIIKVTKRFAKSWNSFASYVGTLIKTLQPAMKWVLVVDEDVEDLTDFQQIMNMMVGKFQASKDLTIIPRTQGNSLDPSEPWAGGWAITDFIIVDLTEPPAPYDEGYKRGVALPPRYATEKVLANWKGYGFGEMP